MAPAIPEAPPEVQARLYHLVGLPYVCLVEDPKAAERFVCQLRNGTRMSARGVEDIFNAALVIEFLEGSGSATRQTEDPTSGSSKLHAEMLAQAERLFGIAVREALPIYLAMDRYEYAAWADRPRVKWPRPQVN
jgi:hypothetical protein